MPTFLPVSDSHTHTRARAHPHTCSLPCVSITSLSLSPYTLVVHTLHPLYPLTSLRPHSYASVWSQHPRLVLAASPSGFLDPLSLSLGAVNSLLGPSLRAAVRQTTTPEMAPSLSKAFVELRHGLAQIINEFNFVVNDPRLHPPEWCVEEREGRRRLCKFVLLISTASYL